MLQPHEIYLSLGATSPDRQSACRELFRQALDPSLVHDMRANVQTGTPLSNDRLRRQIGKKGTDPFSNLGHL
jgi:hypothetical protein